MRESAGGDMEALCIEIEITAVIVTAVAIAMTVMITLTLTGIEGNGDDTKGEEDMSSTMSGSPIELIVNDGPSP